MNYVFLISFVNCFRWPDDEKIIHVDYHYIIQVFLCLLDRVTL